MSFISEEDIYNLIEELITKLFKEILGIEIPRPFHRLTYQEAMNRYGTDRPDLRFGLEIVDLTALVRNSEVKVFCETAKRADVLRPSGFPEAPPFPEKSWMIWSGWPRDGGPKVWHGPRSIPKDGNPL